MTVGANTERMWQALCREVLERPEWANSPQYGTATNRLINVDALEQDIESVLTTQTTEHWVAKMLAAGVPAGPVNTYDQMLADPHLSSREVTTTIEHPTMGTLRALTSPLRMSGTPPQISRAAPLFGQHSAEVLEAFGYSAMEIQTLHKSGTLFDIGLSGNDA